MEKFFKTPTNTSTKKRKRSINLLFLEKYGIADASGKRICVVCSKELAEESLKPSETYGNSCKYCCHVRRGRQESFPLSLCKFNQVAGSFMHSSIIKRKD